MHTRTVYTTHYIIPRLHINKTGHFIQINPPVLIGCDSSDVFLILKRNTPEQIILFKNCVIERGDCYGMFHAR